MHEVLTVRDEFIQDFGEAYQNFGLPKLMGFVVGLLMANEKPLSLDEITKELGVSKGPVSQVMSRLRDNGLVHRTNLPGNRKDYYKVDPDIFGKAFKNHAGLLHRNLLLAEKFQQMIQETSDGASDENIALAKKVDEMRRFYTMMDKHLDAFMEEWRASR